MIRTRNIIGVAILVLFTIACGDKTAEHDMHEGHKHDMNEGEFHDMKPQYKITESGEIKSSFEMTTRAFHHKMMKKMKMEMTHSVKGDHYLMLTLLTASDSQVITDVKNLQILIVSPDGKETKGNAHVMSGKGMHHFGIDFNYTKKGEYKVSAHFERGGKKYSPTVIFKM